VSARPAWLRWLALAASPLTAILTSPMRFASWLTDWSAWWWATPARRRQAAALLAVLAVGVLFTRTSRLELHFERALGDPARRAETLYLPPPTALRALSLGHESFLADLLFIRANNYFIEHVFGDRLFPWLRPYFDALVGLDPDNDRVYEWASQGVKMGQLIDNDVVRQSNDYARAGLKRFPDNWRFYFDIGFNYLVEWHPKDYAERQRMRAKAVPYLTVAAALPGSELDPNFISALWVQEDSVEMALFQLYLRYWEASEAEREQLRRRILMYGTRASAERLARIEKRWKAQYPYIPEGLFELLGVDRDRRPHAPRSWARPAWEDTPAVSSPSEEPPRAPTPERPSQESHP